MRKVKLEKDIVKGILNDLLKRSPVNYGTYTETVNAIVDDIKNRKDEALFEYTKNFDNADVNASNILVTNEEIEEAFSLVGSDLVETMEKAAANIREYHEKQRQYSWFDYKEDGSILGQKVSAIYSAGVYVPGGKAAYPSSVLMNIIPAKVAGVKELIMRTPPSKEGKVNPGTLVAAKIAGIDSNCCNGVWNRICT